MSYIFEKLGGICIDDQGNNILDLEFPENIHERSSLLMFNKKDFELFNNLD